MCEKLAVVIPMMQAKIEATCAWRRLANIEANLPAIGFLAQIHQITSEKVDVKLCKIKNCAY